MPPEGPTPNLRKTLHWQREAARDYYLRHPTASISQVAEALSIGVRTVARARAVLVRQGLLPEGRGNESIAETAASTTAALTTEGDSGLTTGVPDPASIAASAPPPGQVGRRAMGGAIANSLLDSEALRSMEEMLDSLGEDPDDEMTRTRMLRQVQRFSFDPRLTADTRMAASQLWAKLKDMARSKELGPGKPKTLAEAIERATDFCAAAGLKVMVPAFYAAFNLGPVPGTEPASEGTAP